MLEYFGELKTALDERESVDVVYLDCQKVIYTVPHRKLLLKLRTVSVGGMILKQTEAFLTNRQQRMVVKGASSEWLPI